MNEKFKCKWCKDTGWMEPIGPCLDGSYITSSPCIAKCEAYYGWLDSWNKPVKPKDKE